MSIVLIKDSVDDADSAVVDDMIEDDGIVEVGIVEVDGDPKDTIVNAVEVGVPGDISNDCDVLDGVGVKMVDTSTVVEVSGEDGRFEDASVVAVIAGASDLLGNTVGVELKNQLEYQPDNQANVGVVNEVAAAGDSEALPYED